MNVDARAAVISVARSMLWVREIGANLTKLEVDDPVKELILANATTGQAAGLNVTLAAAAHLYKCTARTQVRMYISTAGGTPAAGTLKFHIQYFVDPEFSTTALTAA